MKVLQIHNKYQLPGGEDAIVQIEANLVAEQGVIIETIYFSNESINPFKIFKNTTSESIILKKINEFKPDLVHIHNLFYKASPSIIELIKKKKIPIVMTLHNYRLICTGALLMRDNQICTKCVHQNFPIYSAYYKCFQNSFLKSLLLTLSIGWHKHFKTWNSVDKFIVLTEFAKTRILNSSLAISKDQIIVKSNSVADFGKINYQRADYFLFIGRISIEKGINVISEAFYNTNHLLEVIGDGPLLHEWKKNASSNISFHGYKDISFVIEKIKLCKALIVSSVCYEGLPTNILEAFSAGTPVICSDIDNLNTIVEDKYNGFHFKTGNSLNLKDKLNSYQFDKQIAQNARKTFEEKYSKQQNISQLISIYNSVIKK